MISYFIKVNCSLLTLVKHFFFNKHNLSLSFNQNSSSNMKHIKMGSIKHNDTLSFQIIVIKREHINPPNHNWHKDINLEIKIRVLLPSNGVNVSCIPNANRA